MQKQEKSGNDENFVAAGLTHSLDSDGSVSRYRIAIDVHTVAQPVLSNQVLSCSSIFIRRHLIDNVVLLN